MTQRPTGPRYTEVQTPQQRVTCREEVGSLLGLGFPVVRYPLSDMIRKGSFQSVNSRRM